MDTYKAVPPVLFGDLDPPVETDIIVSLARQHRLESPVLLDLLGNQLRQGQRVIFLGRAVLRRRSGLAPSMPRIDDHHVVTALRDSPRFLSLLPFLGHGYRPVHIDDDPVARMYIVGFKRKMLVARLRRQVDHYLCSVREPVDPHPVYDSISDLELTQSRRESPFRDIDDDPVWAAALGDLVDTFAAHIEDDPRVLRRRPMTQAYEFSSRRSRLATGHGYRKDCRDSDCNDYDTQNMFHDASPPRAALYADASYCTASQADRPASGHAQSDRMTGGAR